MSLTEHVASWAGKPVREFDGEMPFDFGSAVPRLALDWEAHVDGRNMGDLVGELLRLPDVTRASGLVFGAWDFLSSVDSSVIVEALVAAKDRLPNLRALFLGDIVESEQELAWIAQSNVAPLLAAFPHLEELRVRGTSGLKLDGSGEVLSHAKLRSLVIESAGLANGLVQTLLAAQLPALEHLELWIGATEQGATVTAADLAPLFEGERFPALKTLALKNAEDADAVAKAVANAPLLRRIKKLDLSLGTLSDSGAEALLESPLVAQLEDLDLRKSYLSPEIIKRFHALVPVIVDIRGSRHGSDGERRPSTFPPKRNIEVELPLARLRAKRA